MSTTPRTVAATHFSRRSSHPKANGNGIQNNNDKKRKKEEDMMKPKRKRKRQTASSRAKERQERFEKLDNQSRRKIRREAKVVKTFLCQKWVRKLKEKGGDEGNEKKKKRQDQGEGGGEEEEEEVWKVIKSIDLDTVVQHVLQDKLGFHLLNPVAEATTTKTTIDSTTDDNQKGHDDDDDDDKEEKRESENDKDDIRDKDNDENESDDADNMNDKMGEERKDPPRDKRRLDKVLKLFFQHKRLQAVMKEVNDKISEYRCWVLQQEDFAQGRRASTNDRPSHIPTSSLFVGSLSSREQAAEYGREEEEDEEDDDDPLVGPPKKKNRKGQRARRAKALAVEAAREGRAMDKSHNWRDKKKKKKKKPQQQQAQRGAGGGSALASAEAAAAHPSWAAAKQAKVGIVKFEGTKIKFD